MSAAVDAERTIVASYERAFVPCACDLLIAAVFAPTRGVRQLEHAHSRSQLEPVEGRLAELRSRRPALRALRNDMAKIPALARATERRRLHRRRLRRAASGVVVFAREELARGTVRLSVARREHSANTA